MNHENQACTYKGVVHKVGKTVTFPSGFAKRELVTIEDPLGNYKNYAAFEFLRTSSRDATTLLDGIREGDRVTVKFFPSANESKKTPGAWFTSNRAVSITRDGSFGGEVELLRTDITPKPATIGAPTIDPAQADDELPF